MKNKYKHARLCTKMSNLNNINIMKYLNFIKSLVVLVGVLLSSAQVCADPDEDIARYSVLKGNEQLYASKYKLYLPTEEELRREIERQKEIYQLQHD